MRAVLAIAGSDSSGCAGIAADIRAITVAGAHAAVALTCVTAQTRAAISAFLAVDAAALRAQIGAAFDDLPLAAVKSGAIPTAELAAVIADEIARRGRLPYVLDPVMATTSGSPLASPEALAVIQARLFPLATLITPNAPEAAALTGLPVRSVSDAERAGRALVAGGCAAVLVKGGHFDGPLGTDVLVTAAGARVFSGTAIENANTRGSGCTLASAIAAYLASGLPLEEAVIAGRALVAAAIRGGYDLGGRGPVDAFAPLRDPSAELLRERPTEAAHA